KRPSLRLRRETCNTAPPWQSAPATPPSTLACPRATATSASRLSPRAPQRKSPADAGGCDLRDRAGLACGDRIHLLQSSVRRVEVNTAIAPEPHTVAIPLWVAQGQAAAVYELPAVFSAARRMIEQPDL